MSEKEVRVRLKIEADTAEVAKAAASSQTALSKPIDEARKKAMMAANEDRKLYYETIKRLDAEDQAEKRRVRTASDADRQLFYQTTQRLKQEDAAKDAAAKKDQERLAVMARQEQQAIAMQRSQARQTLAMTGLGLSGLGGIAGGYGTGLSIGSGLEALGVSAGVARMAGPVGLAASSGASIARMYADYTAAQQRFSPSAAFANPYLDDNTRMRGMIGSLPLGTRLLEFQDAQSGRAEGFARNSEAGQRLGLRLGYESMSQPIMSDVARQQAAGAATAEGFRRFPFAMPQSFDQSSASGERMQREADVMAQADRQRQVAARELFKATRDREYLERNSLKLAKEAADNTIDRKAQEKQVADLLALQAKEQGKIATSAAKGVAGMFSGNPLAALGFGATYLGSADYSVGINNARTQLQQFEKRGLDINDQRRANEAALAKAKEQEANAERNKGEADLGMKRATLANLQSREQLGSSQAVGIAGLGVDGRAKGMSYLQALQKIGVENAPASLIAEASAVAPLEVKKMQERAGVGIAQGKFGEQLKGMGFEEDVGYASNLKSIREQVNGLRREITGGENDLNLKLGKATEDFTTGLNKLLTLLGEVYPAKFRELENDLRLSNNFK